MTLAPPPPPFPFIFMFCFYDYNSCLNFYSTFIKQFQCEPFVLLKIYQYSRTKHFYCETLESRLFLFKLLDSFTEIGFINPLMSYSINFIGDGPDNFEERNLFSHTSLYYLKLKLY